MSLPRESCYKSHNGHSAFIEFHLDEHRRKAFSTSHLITYSLDPNPEAADDKTEPPQKLHLAFSTADVFILGWRLTTNYIGEIERAEKKITLETLEKIAKVLGLKVRDLIGDT